MTRRSDLDFSLYAIADASVLPPSHAPSLVERAIAGGVTAVQVRAKGFEDAAFLDFACAIVDAASRHGVPTLVNDRVDIALASGVRGVHLGAGDIPPTVARRLLGPAAVIGVTAHSLEEVRAAEGWGAHYIGFGSIYPSPSKAVETIQGLEGLRRARPLTELPIIAIGGVTVDRASEVIAAGADGIAVISGLWSAEDPESRAREYARAIKLGRESRDGWHQR
jgi:thiamine-phosphate pyrophosphorylase